MNKETSKHMTDKEKEQLEAFSTLPDNQIDTDDIPEVQNWSGAKRDLFYRPIKQLRQGLEGLFERQTLNKTMGDRKPLTRLVVKGAIDLN